MIRTFRHRGLERFFATGDHRKIPADRAARIERMLDRLDASGHPQDMNLPGYRWHPLRGKRKGSYAVDVSGNLRITFRFDGEDAIDVDLEDYH
ncbi:MAG TPA: type II toxin-antitoxin system RelE/ParE family toxin [Steroidobacteraceae bacterium]